ncbi:ribosome assembly cofactor RimP [Faecalibacter bovis]|uniref:Ribosome maturation factor RimP n=1 Tax=Faecalibacter bovis TaxID=2898187 RepID=A0ABX7XEM2_9FLAO|nr:ribosome assembly cofactor RimP [Faecalibacter bovis]MBS7332426.1 ribosome assembly cofactor RimP [Weeksellaceae bacterium]QTV06391.1 ribosome assembly cofactor RimP [Faecalibacter bovis]
MDSNKVKQIVEEAIAENPALFLIDWKISPDDKISILADGDEGLSIEEIVRISRYVENNLDREECDFSLEVSSPGVGSPLVMPRQYKKNIGRLLEATLNDDTKLEGEIVEADEEGVILWWETREPKPLGKGKVTVEKEEKVNYSEIKKAIIKVTF